MHKWEMDSDGCLVKPPIGARLMLYRYGQELEMFTVAEWLDNKCFMSDGFYFEWSKTRGFLL